MGKKLKIWESRSRVDFTTNSNCLSHCQIDRYVRSTKRLFYHVRCAQDKDGKYPLPNPLRINGDQFSSAAGQTTSNITAVQPAHPKRVTKSLHTRVRAAPQSESGSSFYILYRIRKNTENRLVTLFLLDINSYSRQ